FVIDDVDEARAWQDFRFRKDDLYRLKAVLGIPEVWVCKNRSTFPGDTALLLVLLRRLSYPGRLNDLEGLFQREYSQLARLFGEVVDFVMEHHAHRVNDYLGYWNPLFEQMAHMVALKGERLLGL
ncbi:unnamed protein product, partial [Hapterophycus canaliculatus]